MIALTPSPPYYAVIFTSLRTEGDQGYAETSKRLDELAEKAPGFLGQETVRSGLGVSISYWKDLDSIRIWKQEAEHLVAQQLGKEKWYTHYKVRIAKVERDYGFTKHP